MVDPVRTFRHKLRKAGGSTLYTSLSKKATLKLKQIKKDTGMSKREIIEVAIEHYVP